MSCLRVTNVQKQSLVIALILSYLGSLIYLKYLKCCEDCVHDKSEKKRVQYPFVEEPEDFTFQNTSYKLFNNFPSNGDFSHIKPMRSGLPIILNWRFVSTGSYINCHHRPLNDIGRTDVNFTIPEPRNGKELQFAYVWYVTSHNYFCSAFASLQKAQILAKEANFPFNLSYILVHAAEDISSQEDLDLLKSWHKLGGKNISMPSQKHYLHSKYYRKCYHKFFGFRLKEYDRVIIMDTDGIIARDLSHLFLLHMYPLAQIAAPQAYWFSRAGVSSGELVCPGKQIPVVSSELLVVDRPSEELFDRVRRHFGTKRLRDHNVMDELDGILGYTKSEMFDMDIINKEFSCKREVLVLPKVYGTLNSDFYFKSRLYQELRHCRDFSIVHYMHFSVMKKFWMHQPYSLTDLIANFSPEVAKSYQDWHKLVEPFCPKLLPEEE